jgi:chemotaxis protein MotB
MARKHKHPEHENLERWLVSYADFMTLLFATFTALYALAQTDAAKLKDVGAAIKEGFAEQSLINGIKSILQGQSPPTENPDPISSDKGAGPGVIGKFDSMTYQPGEVKSTQHLVDDLTSDLKQLNKTLQQAKNTQGKLAGQQGQSGTGPGAEGLGTGADGKGSSPAEQEKAEAKKKEEADNPLQQISLSYQQRGIRISFDSRLLFEAGSASLRPVGLHFLDAVAIRLKKFDNRRFHIEGHTDSSGIASAMFPSNWELSSARASRVVRYFIDRHQFNPAAMVAVGYGSTQPIADNRTIEGRTRNRRVDIILYNADEALRLNPRIQFLGERPVNVRSNDALAPPIPKPAPPSLPASPGKPEDKSAHDAKQGETPIFRSDQPLRIIIKEKNGEEKVWVPGTPSPIVPSKDKSKEATPHNAEPKPVHSPTMKHAPTTSKPKSGTSTPATKPPIPSTKPPVPGHAN